MSHPILDAALQIAARVCREMQANGSHPDNGADGCPWCAHIELNVLQGDPILAFVRRQVLKEAQRVRAERAPEVHSGPFSTACQRDPACVLQRDHVAQCAPMFSGKGEA